MSLCSVLTSNGVSTLFGNNSMYGKLQIQLETPILESQLFLNELSMFN